MRVKTTITDIPIFRLLDFLKEFIVEIDASGTEIGAVSMQDKQPVAYYGRKLGPYGDHL